MRNAAETPASVAPAGGSLFGRVRSWARRTAELQGELAALAELDPRWWLLAAGAALVEPSIPTQVYLASDAEPDADTFMGYAAPAPRDLVSDAMRRALAARTALAELDGTLPEQPLAVTLQGTRGARPTPCSLEVAAFAVGPWCLRARLDAPDLADQLAAMLAGTPPPRWHGPPPFVCVSLGDEPLVTARHGHRRAWSRHGGPWLGLGRAGGLALVSTCHLVVDGYGHARITARIAELTASAGSDLSRSGAPPLAAVPAAVPLTIAWRKLPQPTPRLVHLAHRLAGLLHHRAGRPQARFSPTIQVPVARGGKEDPLRLRRRIVSATLSARFTDGQLEPLSSFERRARDIFAREAAAQGLISRLLSAASAVPVPLSWKRRSIGATRPRWLESFAEVIGGRALLSRIALDVPSPALCAVSSPARLASKDDPFGGCVITLVDDGREGMITVGGSGFLANTGDASAFLDELLELSTPETIRMTP